MQLSINEKLSLSRFNDSFSSYMHKFLFRDKSYIYIYIYIYIHIYIKSVIQQY